MTQTLPSLSSDVANAFANAKAEGRPAFIPYITAGYPRAPDTVPVLLTLQANGADIIEIGVPFSDPIADGNTIQAANQQALDNGVSLQDTIEYVVEARKQGLTVPIVLMGYYNPFLQFGEQKLVDTCADARIHGFIVVDLPPVEALQFRTICDSRDMCLVPLVSPTTTDERLAVMGACQTPCVPACVCLFMPVLCSHVICFLLCFFIAGCFFVARVLVCGVLPPGQMAKGYVYCVSLNGVTGARTELPEHLGAFLDRVRVHMKCPLAVGFGLSTRAHVKAVGQLADGAIIGSAVIKALAKGKNTAESVASVGKYVFEVTHD